VVKRGRRPCGRRPVLGSLSAFNRQVEGADDRRDKPRERARLLRNTLAFRAGGLDTASPALPPRRHGLNTRLKRLALVAGYRARYEPPRDPEPQPQIEVERPGELVGIDCFFVGRLIGSSGPVWQITAVDCYSSYGWADLVVCPPAGPTVAQTSKLARRVAVELQQAGWRLERVLTDNGGEFGRREFRKRLPDGVIQTQIRSGRPQTNGHVERLHRTILEECWRPVFARFLHPRYTGVARELASYLRYYNHQRAHTGRRTAGRTPAELIYGARKMRPK
jgi:transposase InsO family protein